MFSVFGSRESNLEYWTGRRASFACILLPATCGRGATGSITVSKTVDVGSSPTAYARAG